jgi:hypothetical protein
MVDYRITVYKDLFMLYVLDRSRGKKQQLPFTSTLIREVSVYHCMLVVTEEGTTIRAQCRFQKHGDFIEMIDDEWGLRSNLVS